MDILKRIEMSLKDKISEIIEPSLNKSGFELVELKLSSYKKNNGVRIFIDSDNGVMLDDCARVSKQIDKILEDNNIFSEAYTIEVSSPGLDRPLKTARDFRRRIGEQVMIFLNDNKARPVKGELIGVGGHHIELRLNEGLQKLDLSEIIMGKIIL